MTYLLLIVTNQATPSVISNNSSVTVVFAYRSSSDAISWITVWMEATRKNAQIISKLCGWYCKFIIFRSCRLSLPNL